LRRLVSEGGSSDDKRTSGHPGLPGHPGHPGRPYSAAEELFEKNRFRRLVSEGIIVDIGHPGPPGLPGRPGLPDRNS